MARKKSQQQFSIEDLIRLGSKKAILVIIAAIAVYFFGGQGIPDLGQNTPVEQDDSGFVMGTVTRVVDGDTAEITVDGAKRRVRFLGVDTPETVHPNKPVQFFGPEASAFTKESLTGKRVWLEYDKNPQDRYSRHLAYIWTAKPKSINTETIRRDMFNAKMLLGGYAKVMIIKPNNRYAQQFKEFEAEARNLRRGLWAQ
ncbi:MAG: thermonuclease family protein, partial [Synergistaceae bacterium]|nr:thermonuclease family protein [Synergistaceae bacterium]